MKKVLWVVLMGSLLPTLSFAKKSDWQKYVPEIGRQYIPDGAKSDSSEKSVKDADWAKYIPDHAKQYISGKVVDDKGRSAYYGPTNIAKKELKTVTIMGPAHVEKSKISVLDISGPAKIRKSSLKNLTVRGPLSISKHSKVKKDVLIMGPMSAEDTKFKGNLEIHSTKASFKDCHVSGNVTIISERQPPVLSLKNTTIDGQVRFEKNYGYVENDSSSVKKGIMGEANPEACGH
jgi:hypothetical protein